MSSNKKGLRALDVPVRQQKSIYPPQFAKRVEGRDKRKLGDHFGLKNFGVNFTTMLPGSNSALMHRHSKQDEFIYVLEGEATLITDEFEQTLRAGDCVGFPAGGVAHQLVNRSEKILVYLEIGDRTVGDSVEYPNDDLKAVMGSDGQWILTRKDGTPY
jgi:uncharacterized cupin superfamily protein